MAIKLNTSQNESHEEIVKRKNRRIAKNFKYAMFGLIGVTVLLSAIQVVRIVAKSIEVKKNEAFFNGYVDEYHALQEKYGVSSNTTEEVTVEDTEATAEDPTIVVDTFYDAIATGELVAELETEYTSKGMLLNEDWESLSTHCSDSSNWLEVDRNIIANKIDVEWKFETRYKIDGGGQSVSNININDCVWCCYHVSPGGTRYPLMYVVGSYNVNGDYFTVASKYITDYGVMYIHNGIIEKTTDEIMPEAQDAQEISDLLKNNEGGENLGVEDFDELQESTEENSDSEVTEESETDENTDNEDTDGGN